MFGALVLIFAVTSSFIDSSDGRIVVVRTEEKKASLLKIPCPNFHEVSIDNCDGDA